MATKYIDSITYGSDEYKFVDDVSGYSKKMVWYGESSTQASVADKVITCSGFTLETGAIIGIYFSQANTTSVLLTFNINNTGAKYVYIGAGSTDSTNTLEWSGVSMVYVMYDGSHYQYITSISNANLAPSRGANTWIGTSNSNASSQYKTANIDNYVLTKGSLLSITFSTANTYTSAKISLSINGGGYKDIYYNGAVTSSTNTLLWDANTTITFIYDGTGYVFVCSSKGGTVTDVQVNGTSVLSSGVANLVTNTAYNASTNKIATMSDVESHGSTAVVEGTTLYIVTDIQSGDEVNY